MTYEYKVLRIFGMKPQEVEKQLNALGVESYAIIYANEAIIILGRRKPEEGERSTEPIGKAVIVALPTRREAQMN